jgi:spermidine/putrescine transport system permease protein
MNKMYKLMIIIFLIYFSIFFYIPIINLFYISLKKSAIYGGVTNIWSLESWYYAFNIKILNVIIRSFINSTISTIICIFLSYLVILNIFKLEVKNQYKIVSLILITIVIDPLIKSISLSQLLGISGFGNIILKELNLIDNNIEFLFNNNIINFMFVINYFPYLLAFLWISSIKINKNLLIALEDLGGTKMNLIKNILIPFTKKNLLLGTLVVWTSMFLNITIPEILGGGKKISLGKLISYQYFEMSNWSLGASISLLSSIICLSLFLSLNKMFYMYENNK